MLKEENDIVIFIRFIDNEYFIGHCSNKICSKANKEDFKIKVFFDNMDDGDIYIIIKKYNDTVHPKIEQDNIYSSRSESLYLFASHNSLYSVKKKLSELRNELMCKGYKIIEEIEGDIYKKID